MKNEMEIIPVSCMEEVIKNALVEQPVAIEWEMPSDDAPTVVQGDDAASGLVAH